MKSIQLLLLTAVLILTASSCRKGGPWGIRGKGENITETRSLDGFDRIDLSIDAEVYYTQDSVYRVEISAQQNILAVLKTEVKNSALVFDFKRNVWQHNDIKVTIHSPSIRRIAVSGSGNVTVQNEISSNNMELSISGSGNVSLPSLKAKSLKASISGAGDLTISGGTVDNETLTVSGSGNVDMEKLQSQTAKVTVSGSGNVTVNVIEDLSVSISGSGNVRYRGRPYISSDISGSGRLTRID